jgi:hypothetical protein
MIYLERSEVLERATALYLERHPQEKAPKHILPVAVFIIMKQVREGKNVIQFLDDALRQEQERNLAPLFVSVHKVHTEVLEAIRQLLEEKEETLILNLE